MVKTDPQTGYREGAEVLYRLMLQWLSSKQWNLPQGMRLVTLRVLLGYCQNIQRNRTLHSRIRGGKWVSFPLHLLNCFPKKLIRR